MGFYDRKSFAAPFLVAAWTILSCCSSESIMDKVGSHQDKSSRRKTEWQMTRTRQRINTASPSPTVAPGNQTEPSLTSSSNRWQDSYDRVINNSFESTWDFYGWWRIQPWNGGSRKPIQNYTAQLNLYGTVSEANRTNNVVSITLFDNLDLQFQLKVTNAGNDCTGQRSTNPDACIVAIHSGNSCDTASDIGRMFYDSSKIEWTNGNPFVKALYASDSAGVSNSIVNLFNGGNGYGKDDNNQRPLVLYDSQGNAVLCGIMAEGDNVNTFAPTISPTTRKTPKPAATRAPSALPTTAKPTTTKPISSAPTTASPTTRQPVETRAPSASSTTANPTTAKPISSAPTTASPTTRPPVETRAPSAVPTTTRPTTVVPMIGTPVPSTARPTTLTPMFVPTLGPSLTFGPTSSTFGPTPSTFGPTPISQPLVPTIPLQKTPTTPSTPATPSLIGPIAPSQIAPAVPALFPTAPGAPSTPGAPSFPISAPATPLSMPANPANPAIPSPKVVDGVSAKIRYNGIGWIGVAGSLSGKMLDAKGAIIGLPNGPNTVSTNVMIYNMTSKDVAGIIPRSADQQLLQNQTITQSATDTTMIWSMPFPPNQLNIFPVIWAYGLSNTFAYHGSNRSSSMFPLNLNYCVDGGNSGSTSCKPDDPNYDQVNVLVSGSTGPILTLYTKNIKLYYG